MVIPVRSTAGVPAGALQLALRGRRVAGAWMGYESHRAATLQVHEAAAAYAYGHLRCIKFFMAPECVLDA